MEQRYNKAMDELPQKVCVFGKTKQIPRVLNLSINPCPHLDHRTEKGRVFHRESNTSAGKFAR